MPVTWAMWGAQAGQQAGLASNDQTRSAGAEPVAEIVVRTDMVRYGRMTR